MQHGRPIRARLQAGRGAGCAFLAAGSAALWGLCGAPTRCPRGGSVRVFIKDELHDMQERDAFPTPQRALMWAAAIRVARRGAVTQSARRLLSTRSLFVICGTSPSEKNKTQNKPRRVGSDLLMSCS